SVEDFVDAPHSTTTQLANNGEASRLCWWRRSLGCRRTLARGDVLSYRNVRLPEPRARDLLRVERRERRAIVRTIGVLFPHEPSMLPSAAARRSIRAAPKGASTCSESSDAEATCRR